MYYQFFKVEEAVLVAGSNKKLILVLNKIGKLFMILLMRIFISEYSRPSTQRGCRKMDEVSQE